MHMSPPIREDKRNFPGIRNLPDADRARGSVLERGNQVGPTASVTRCEAEANANEFGDVAAVPLRLPARRLTW